MITNAEVVLDNESPDGHRLLTYSLMYPKMVHGEVMTHRRFSRNASSSRAIPTVRLVRDSLKNMYTPTFVQNQRGMQGGGEVPEPQQTAIRDIWGRLAHVTADEVEIMSSMGAHKQHVNRPLEWFGWIRVLVSTTEYMNFFGLRLDKAAQPEIRHLAELMWRGYNESRPTRLQPGQWHAPFVDEETAREATPPGELVRQSTMLNISAARCARISYTSFDTGKKSTVGEDMALADRLIQQGHWSPFEHQATPDTGLHHHRIGSTDSVLLGDHFSEWGNFTGWRQNRKMHAGESVAELPAEIMRTSEPPPHGQTQGS